jgi:hypothetical protein
LLWILIDLLGFTVSCLGFRVTTIDKNHKKSKKSTTINDNQQKNKQLDSAVRAIVLRTDELFELGGLLRVEHFFVDPGREMSAKSQHATLFDQLLVI